MGEMSVRYRIDYGEMVAKPDAVNSTARYIVRLLAWRVRQPRRNAAASRLNRSGASRMRKWPASRTGMYFRLR